MLWPYWNSKCQYGGGLCVRQPRTPRRLNTVLHFPTMVCAPSLQISMHSSHLIPASVMYESIILKRSSAVAVFGMYLKNSKSSFSDLKSTHCTSQLSCHCCWSGFYKTSLLPMILVNFFFFFWKTQVAFEHNSHCSQCVFLILWVSCCPCFKA